MSTDLARQFEALAECLRLLAGGIDRLAARVAMPTQPAEAVPQAEPAEEQKPARKRTDPRAGAEGPRWTAERIALVTAELAAKAAGTRTDWKGLAARLSALPGPFVAAQHAHDWWCKVGASRARAARTRALEAEAPIPTAPAQAPTQPAAQPPAKPWPLPKPGRAVRLPGAADELQREIADATTAPADSETIRSWGLANGVALAAKGRLGEAAVRLVNERRAAEKLPTFRLVERPIGAIPAAELARMRGAGEVRSVSASGYDTGAPASR